MNKSGTSLLVVLLASGLLSICLLNVWKATAYSTDVVLQRQKHLEHIWLLQGLLQYGVELSIKNFDTLVAARSPKKLLDTIVVEKFHTLRDKAVAAKIVFETKRKAQKIALKVTISAENKSLGQASCVVQRMNVDNDRTGLRDRLVVTEWHVGKA